MASPAQHLSTLTTSAAVMPSQPGQPLRASPSQSTSQISVKPALPASPMDHTTQSVHMPASTSSSPVPAQSEQEVPAKPAKSNTDPVSKPPELVAAELEVAKKTQAVTMADRARGWMEESERREQETKAGEELKAAKEHLKTLKELYNSR